MKSPTQITFGQSRMLLAAVFAVLFGTATAVAQSSSSGSTSSSSAGPSTSSTDTSRSATATKTPTPNPADANAYHSGTAPADVDATKEINAENDTTSAGKMTGRESTGHKLGWMDRRFVSKAADGGADEIALAKLATERASNPEVKSFAQKLVTDHEKVAAELKEIASQKNVKIDEDNDHDRTYKRLEKRSGTDFDREFVEHMIDEHEKDIKMFEKAAKDAKDSDVRSFASKHVDDLKQHLQQAQSLRQTVMPTGRMERSSRSSASPSNDYKSSSSTSSSQEYPENSSTPSTSHNSRASDDTTTQPKPDSSR